MRSAVVAVVAVALLLAAGCGGASAWPPPPAQVHLGEDACAFCRMIVSDARFAAQAQTRTAAGAQVFDDLGCLITSSKSAPLDPQGIYVRQFDGDAWVRGDQAVVVRAEDISSPMGSGLAVFATRTAAESEAARHPGATVEELAALVAAPVAR
jgi:copper chaperone NosL